MTPHSRAGTGEPLVLIHGFSNTWRVWEPILPMLAEHHDVLAPTLAGHHEGLPLDEGIEATVDALTDAIARQMDEAGFDTAHIAGNSLGAWIALDLARRGRARSVVAIGPAGGWAHGDREERRLRRLFKVAHRITGLVEPRAEQLVRRPGIRKLLFGQAMAHPERMSPAAAAHRLRATVGCAIYFDLMDTIMRDGPPDWFGEIQTPVLVAWPEHDRIVPQSTCSAGFRALPNAEWVTLPGVGHVPMTDDPPLAARTILDFVRTAQPAAVS